MTQEEKQLLIRDLCTRLPYGVKGLHREQVHKLFTIDGREENNACIQVDGYDAWFSVDTFKPYLRPLLSMTKEERTEREKFIKCIIDEKNHYRHYVVFPHDSVDYHDWLDAHHFDYRGLIPMGLALEAPEGMYND